MRLRLLVQRNGFPPTQVIWSSKGLSPDREAGSEHTTVAQLLEQVNEIIPLESDDWGLEDYAVELQGFECLHFSVLNQILKEDDQVTIRPLQLSDRRVRRVSGRHQISIDGRHLYDGVAFGRPLLKRPWRPPVRIPSLKRPRLEYEQDGDDDNVEANTQLLLEQPEDDDPLRYLFEEEEEYNGIVDAGSGGELNASLDSDQGCRRGSRKRRRTGLGIDSGDVPLQDGSAGLVNGAATHEDGLLPHANGPVAQPGDHRNSRRGSRSSTKSVRFDGDNLETPATILAIHESDSDDDDFEPAKEVDSSDSSDKENMEPQVNGVDEQTSSDDETSSSGATSSEPGDSATSDGSTTGSDASEAEGSKSESESDDSSDSSSEDSDMESKARNVVKSGKAPKATSSPQGSGKATNVQKRTQKPEVPQGNAFTPPNQGTSSTKNRNARRKFKNALDGLKLEGVLPASATITDYKRFMGLIPAANTEIATTGDAAAVEAKRQDLLKSIASSSAKEVTERSQNPPSRSLLSSEQLATDAADPMMDETTQDSAPPLATPVAKDVPTEQGQNPLDLQTEKSPAPAPSQRRMKLDVEASRRFILKSLNLPGPRAKSGTKSRPTSAETPAEGVPAVTEKQTQQEELVRAEAEDEDWRNKIDLRAVECCQEGIKLSTPPFPFYQRWDPQQQIVRRGGRGKKRKRNQQQYNEYQSNDDNYEEPHHYEDDPSFAIEADGSTHDPSSNNLTQAALDDQLLQDASASAINRLLIEDLPALPADLAKRSNASQSDMRPGAIIAFKQMHMSQATNWSPVISEYRTARVKSHAADGMLELTLAHRDVERQEKHFDAQTGQRLYDKFEMPGYDQLEENEDDRFLSIPFIELIDPKLVAPGVDDATAAPESHMAGDAAASKPGLEVQKSFETGHSEETLTEPMVVIPFQQPRETQQAVKQSNGSPATNNKLTEERRADQPTIATAVVIAEEDRRDISLLMKQAGFRSEIRSDVAQGLTELGEGSTGQEKAGSEHVGDVTMTSAEDAPDRSMLDHTNLHSQSSPVTSPYDASAFEDPPTFFEANSVAEDGSSDGADEELPSPAELSMEESTFLPVSNGSESATRHDPDFPAPRRSRRSKSSQSRVADEPDPEEEPLSKRTRSSGASFLDESAHKPERPVTKRNPMKTKNRQRSSPSNKPSSDYDLPSPTALLGPRTQPNPVSTRPYSPVVSPEPELPLSSPVRRGGKRRLVTKFSSPAASDSRSGSHLSDMFAPSDEDDLPLQSSTGKVKSKKGQAGNGSAAPSKKSSAKLGKSRRAQIVDLTLSSDPREGSDESSQNEEEERVERKGTGLPTGAGWVRKSMGGSVRKKTPVRRTRSSV